METEELKNQTAEAAEELKNQAAEATEEVKEQAAETASDVKDSAEDLLKNMKEKAEDVINDISENETVKAVREKVEGWVSEEQCDEGICIDYNPRTHTWIQCRQQGKKRIPLPHRRNLRLILDGRQSCFRIQ
jgi:predicted Holliday junction resolvase-like endonuclease